MSQLSIKLKKKNKGYRGSKYRPKRKIIKKQRVIEDNNKNIRNKEAEEDEYEIEKILQMKGKRGEKQFLVKWKGFTNRYNQWIKEEDMNAEDLVREYKRRRYTSKRKSRINNSKLNKLNFKNKRNDKDIRFYRENEEYGCFSNFSNHKVEIEGKTWPTTEHYFQAMKFEAEFM